MAVVVDVTNGDVLAMATVTGATARRARAVVGPGEVNAPLTDLFEPGSTNKLITLSRAIEHGSSRPTRCSTCRRRCTVGGTPYTDAEPHTATSTDDGGRHPARVVERRHDRDRAAPDEPAARRRRCARSGSARRRRSTSRASRRVCCSTRRSTTTTGHYSTAIGYGVAVTGMQMLDAYATIANGGVTRPPHLLDATIDAKGVRHAAPVSAGHAGRVAADRGRDDADARRRRERTAPARAPRFPATRSRARPEPRRRRSTAATRHGTMASFIGFAPADASAARGASSCSTSPRPQLRRRRPRRRCSPTSCSSRCTQYGVAPDDVANTQYAAAQATARGAGNACAVPPRRRPGRRSRARGGAARRTPRPRPGPRAVGEAAPPARTGCGDDRR